MPNDMDSDLTLLNVQVPFSLRDRVVLHQNTLFVAREYVTDNEVIDFEMKLRRLNVLEKVEAVSIRNLEEMRKRNTAGAGLSKYEQSLELKKAYSLLEQGVKMSASDIHILVNDQGAEIKMRVDGYLGPQAEILRDEAMNLLRAIYVASGSKNMNQFGFEKPIAARLTRNNGEFKLPNDLYAVRFASMGSDNGGIVVLRLLYDGISSRGKKVQKVQLEDLGFTESQAMILKEMAEAPNGMIIIDGPTGSGKSTTLKFTMQWIHETYSHFNILTVEDPPEYPIAGSTQIPVVVQDDDADRVGERGRRYGTAISTALRLDPDILMVGEIRDGHSAIAGLRAAETGHRLWTTLHANDAWEALNRLIDLLREGGMTDPLPVLANTQNLAGLIAQRLVPRLCDNCKRPFSEHQHEAPKAVLAELLDADEDINLKDVFIRGKGCRLCVPMADGDEAHQEADQRHGILGRTVVAEIVRPDQTLLDIARKEGIPAARKYWLKAHDGQLIADSAVQKIKEGVIDPIVAREFIGPLLTGKQVLARMSNSELGEE